MNANQNIFRIKTNNVSPKKGRILIAEPFLPGSYFNRSIIFLVDHNEEGSVGFILNKPVDFPIDDFHEEFPSNRFKLYMGGPVNIDSIYYIHTLGQQIPNSIHIKDELYWGGDYDCLKELINTGVAKPSQVRFFLGYSGWDKNQLKEELEEDSWLVSDISASLVMTDKNELWSEMVKKLGGKYTMWQHFPENPSMN
jgi:putative transcriptional regulator